jgi:hypothetical protein
MKKYGIPKKLYNLLMLTPWKTKGKMKVQNKYPGEFMISLGLRQGDVISPDLLNLVL